MDVIDCAVLVNFSILLHVDTDSDCLYADFTTLDYHFVIRPYVISSTANFVAPL